MPAVTDAMLAGIFLGIGKEPIAGPLKGRSRSEVRAYLLSLCHEYRLIHGESAESPLFFSPHPVIREYFRKSLPDAQTIIEAVKHAVENLEWVDKEELQIVRQFLGHDASEYFQRIILQGGVRGYSVFVYLSAELASYRQQGMNPYNLTQYVVLYPTARAAGLLQEHRFLQAIARAMGYSFSLRELVVYNPHGAEPSDDWNMLVKELPDQLSMDDQILNPSHRSDIRKFYRRFGFEGL